jgi:uncharacterized protein (TIGR00369 family)
MATPTNSNEMTRAQVEVAARGEHVLQQLGTRDVPAPEGRLAMEMDLRPEVANVRGALQGGLIAVLVDICAGRLAYQQCDAEHGYSTATSDLTVHYLSPVAVGPAHVEARVVGRTPTGFVLEVEVTDVGRDHKLAAVSTLAFQVLAPRR